ncbi:MAG: Maf family protein, partial [Castellaniella sp.]
MTPFILLASASPRRHEILDQLGIPHGILRVPAPEGEDEPRLPGEPPADYVRRTARDKAER